MDGTTLDHQELLPGSSNIPGPAPYQRHAQVSLTLQLSNLTAQGHV